MDLLIALMPQNGITNNQGRKLQCNCKKVGELLKSSSYIIHCLWLYCRSKKGLCEYQSFIWLLTTEWLEKQQLNYQQHPSVASCSWNSLKSIPKEAESKPRPEWLTQFFCACLFWETEIESICYAGNREKKQHNFWSIWYLLRTCLVAFKKT